MTYIMFIFLTYNEIPIPKTYMQSRQMQSPVCSSQNRTGWSAPLSPPTLSSPFLAPGHYPGRNAGSGSKRAQSHSPGSSQKHGPGC